MHRFTGKQICVTVFAVCLLGMHFLKRPLYMMLWGERSLNFSTATGERFADIGENLPWQNARISGYDIQYRLRKKYKVCGRAVWVDWNDGVINTWYHSALRPTTKLYNAVAAVDVSIIHGDTSADGNWQKIKFNHEERGLMYNYTYADNPIVNSAEINNNHVIPASFAVRRALAIIKKGEIAEFEGYLMDWKGTGKFADFEVETATYAGELHSKQLYGGKVGAGLCRQFYVTKITVGGYTFE